MRPDRRLSREDVRALRGNFGWRGKSADSAPRIDLRCARQPRFNSNGSGDGSHGYSDAAKRMRSDYAWRSANLSAGIDDAHFYRVDNIEKAALPIPDGAFSIILSHTPEVYRQAAHANFNLMLSGHTHGGQICLPGSIPIKLE